MMVYLFSGIVSFLILYNNHMYMGTIATVAIKHIIENTSNVIDKFRLRYVFYY